MKKLLGFLTIACDNQFLLMKVCNNYSLIHKFLINHILLQTVLIIGVCGACRRKKLYTLKMENVNIREDINLTDTKTNICRSFAITNPNWVETVKKCMSYEKGRCVYGVF
jgi:hypothetical protein